MKESLSRQLLLADQALGAGRLTEAEALCQDVLSASPHCIDALMMGCGLAARRGDGKLAMARIRRAVGVAPERADCHNTLGQMFAAMGQPEQALAAFEVAAAIAPDFAEARYNHGLALRRLDRDAEAVAPLETAASLRPDWADAHFALGNTLLALGDGEGAADRYHATLTLRPGVAEAWNNLGLALGSLDRLDAAADCFGRAVSIKPNYPEALNNLGNALKRAGRLREAVSAFVRCLQYRPEHPETLYNLGGVQHALNDMAAARRSYSQAVACRPDFAMAHNNLGVVLKSQGDWDAALDHYRKAHSLDPENPETCNNLGNVLEKLDHLETAVAFCRKAVALRPDFAEAHNNLGVALNGAGDVLQGDRYFRRAVALRPDFTEARFNHAVARLLLGDFAEGWQAYESRFDRAEWTHIHPYRYSQPRWQGASFAGRRLYIHDEQGFGDTIQFVRYLPRVKALGGTVVFETRKPLIALLEGIDGVDELVVRPGIAEPAAPCDLVVPLMSLPGIFATDAATIPAAIPYLAAKAQRTAAWRTIVEGPGLRVGLVWAGSPNHEQDRRRSCPLEIFACLADLPGVRLWGLQQGPAADAANAVGFLAANLGERFDDFADTAGAIETMDLVISVDTAVAHLAGAMGKPVWVLLPHAPDWRWGLSGSDTPWYPTMTLFRQDLPGDWAGVMVKVAEALTQRLGGPGRPRPSPRSATALRDRFHQAARLHHGGRVDAAERQCLEILEECPDHTDTLNLSAILAQARGATDHAMGFINRAVAAAPENPQLHRNRGRMLMGSGDHGGAAKAFQQALGLTPGDVGTSLDLARALSADAQFEAAASVCRRLIAMKPTDAVALNLLGTVLGKIGREDEAMTLFDRALTCDPTSAEAWTNRGTLLHAQGRLKSAVAAFDRALDIQPGCADARFNRAQVKLLTGDFPNGWRGYEARFDKPAWRRRCPDLSSHRRWQGESLEGGRLVVFDEQGLGDTLQFVRYLPLAKARCERVVLHCAAGLVPLLRGINGVDEVLPVESGGSPLAPGDRYVHLLSLPGIFGTTETTIPRQVPYIFSDPSRVTAWRRRMPGEGLRVGLVWAGNPGHANDGRRSCRLEALSPVLGVPGIRWFGFQKGAGSDQMAGLPRSRQFANIGNDFNDFADTAAAVENLDLVITVDTAVAHLAGAMGRTTWVMLPAVPDWRWLLDRDDSPWYPSLRLFRQQAGEGWDAVAVRLAEALETSAGQMREE